MNLGPGVERPSPDVSIVVIVYNMAREAPRTLLSLSAAYQQQIGADDYEVIVVDNGSTPPLDPAVVGDLAGHFRLIRIDPAPPSPVRAINRGLAEARGNIIGLMVDGARMVTPGLVHFARHGVGLYDRAVVAALTWHLGFDMQSWAITAGYDQAREDALLESIGWPRDGYRLFEISALAGSSVDGWFLPIAESNALFLRREMWDLLGGVDERFDAPGGGLVNLDTFRRAVELPGTELVILLGEGTFHQLHGGIATNADPGLAPRRFREWAAQYQVIRQRAWDAPRPTGERTYLGAFPRPALDRFVHAALYPVRHRLGRDEPPLGPSFDRGLWSFASPVRPADPTIAAVVDLAHTEFRAGRFEAAAAVARLARARAPDEPEPQRLLAGAGTWLPADKPPHERRAAFHLARGEAYRLLGERAASAAEFRAALALEGDLAHAHIGLAKLRMPGEDYYGWLSRFHAALRPETYLEIGVAAGHSLSLARFPTRAIAVDPAPQVNAVLQAQTHIFTETSDEFFTRRRLDGLLAGQALRLAFIDGLHLFEQALRDFMHVEAHCGPRSVLLLHDAAPLDEPTQRRARETQFYSGDVWKTVVCLRSCRPDLDIFTIATPWTGLTVVTGLDPSSRVLADAYDDLVARFIDAPFADVENRLEDAVNIVPNDWDVVAAPLRARGIL